jgi:hypothetical protein
MVERDHLKFLERLWRHRHDSQVCYAIRIELRPVIDWPSRQRHHHHHHHSAEERPLAMSTNPVIPVTTITSPGAYVVTLTLLANGTPFVPTADNAGFTFTPSLTANDTSVTITADATTPDQFDVVVPAGDPNKSVVFTAQAVDPDGNSIVNTLELPFSSVSVAYTIGIVVSQAPTN